MTTSTTISVGVMLCPIPIVLRLEMHPSSVQIIMAIRMTASTPKNIGVIVHLSL